MRIISALLLWFMGLSQAVFAEVIQYYIVPEKTLVGFTYQFGADTIQGRFPDYTADISIDFEKASNSRIDVTLKASTAKAGFLFATQAIRSKKILDGAQYPNIKFLSKSFQSDGVNAIIKGMVTVRGITKPLTLSAQLLRDPGTKPSERDNLRILLSGEINRNDFGATGYPNYVGPTLVINIDARIKKRN